jgi:cytochrome c2
MIEMHRPSRGLMAALGTALLGLAVACADEGVRAAMVPGGDPGRGKQAILDYGCGACHTIPGVRAATGEVGPPLSRFALRAYIAGEVPNTTDYLIQWIVKPQSIEPGTAMPNLGVGESNARDMAAYLYTLR